MAKKITSKKKETKNVISKGYTVIDFVECEIIPFENIEALQKWVNDYEISNLTDHDDFAILEGYLEPIKFGVEENYNFKIIIED